MLLLSDLYKSDFGYFCFRLLFELIFEIDFFCGVLYADRILVNWLDDWLFLLNFGVYFPTLYDIIVSFAFLCIRFYLFEIWNFNVLYFELIELKL